MNDSDGQQRLENALHELQSILIEHTPTEAMSAGDAAFAVGYESPSQFSREYARLYGKPPMQNIQDMRSMLTETSVVVE